MLVLLLAVFVLLKVPELFGYKAYCILSGSMEPQIHTGAVVYVEDIGMDEVKTGDCITFWLGTDTRLTATHRVTAIDWENKEITTKGDANPAEDIMKVRENTLIGKVVFDIPFLGYGAYFLQTVAGKIYCVTTFFLVLINKKEKI